MESEARAVGKLSRAASGFGYSRRRSSTRNAPASELVDSLLDYLIYGDAEFGELAEVLGVAEEILAGKDLRAANLVGARFLEKLLLLVSYPDNPLETETTEQVMGPLSRNCWHDLERLWLTVGHDVDGRPNNPTIDEYLRLSSRQMRREFRSHYLVMPSGELVGVADILSWESGYRYQPTADPTADLTGSEVSAEGVA